MSEEEVKKTSTNQEKVVKPAKAPRPLKNKSETEKSDAESHSGGKKRGRKQSFRRQRRVSFFYIELLNFVNFRVLTFHMMFC